MRYSSFFTDNEHELKSFLNGLDMGDLIEVKLTSSAYRDYIGYGFLVIYRELV